MKRRDFIGVAGASMLVASTDSGCTAGSPVKIKSAVKVSIGHPLADPFCIGTSDGYYLTGTHFQGDLSQSDYMFDLFHSKDLLSWARVGRILKIPEYEGSRKANYWAPEILPYQGKYYLYYTADSFGDPERRFVRVAVADTIVGPYLDCGTTLTSQPSIDGHPVYHSADAGFMFYTGNEGNDHVGQLLVDRLISPTELENKPAKVFPSETVEWEEGAFVVRKDKAFFLFSSRGNWRDGSYHVLVSKSESILGPWIRCAEANGDYNVLSSHGGQLGPGHNSIFSGPEKEMFICYHAWDEEHTGRYPWIAPLQWKGGFPVARQ
jgi:arabinan endo-1,5-alpha-L-arabinosidase